MLIDFDEARKKGEEIYNGIPFRIVMVPNGDHYDILYHALPPDYRDNSGRSLILADRNIINFLGFLEIEEK